MTSLSGLLENGVKGKAVCGTNILSQETEISTATSRNGKENVNETIKLSVSQDLLPKFSNVVVDLDQISTPIAPVGSSIQIVEHAGGKKISPTEDAVVDLDQISTPITHVGSSVQIIEHVGGKRVSPT